MKANCCISPRFAFTLAVSNQSKFDPQQEHTQHMSLVSAIDRGKKAKKESSLIEEFDYSGDSTAPRTMLPMKTKRYSHYKTFTEYPDYTADQDIDHDQEPDTNYKLSRTAIYTTQRKYGQYDSPATHYNIGLSHVPVSIEKAAQNAERSALQVEAYHRDKVSSDAMKAAQNLGGYALMMIKRQNMQNLQLEDQHLQFKQSQRNLYSINSAKSVLNDTDNIINLTREYDLKFPPVKKQMNLSKLLTGAENRANKRITTRYKPDNIQINQKRYQDALNAAIKIHHQDYLPDQMVKENEHEMELNAKKWEIFKQMTSPKVWQLAQETTQIKLQNQLKTNPETMIYGNMEYNRKAVEIAKKRFVKRNAMETEFLEKTSGKINIGGGKWLNSRDIDDTARNLVKPIINEVENKAMLERKNDKEIKQRRTTYIQEAKDWKNDQINKKMNDEILVNEESQKEKDEIEKLNQEFNEAMKLMDNEMQDKINIATTELHNLKKQRHALRKQNDLEISNFSQLKQQEFDKWEIENQDDIKRLNLEEQKIIKSYFGKQDEYTKEQKYLNEKKLQNDKDVKDTTNCIKIHHENINNLQSKLNEILSTSTTAANKEEESKIVAKQKELLNNKTVEENQLIENQKQLVYFKLQNDNLLEKQKVNNENLRLIKNKIKIMESAKDLKTKEKILHEKNIEEKDNLNKNTQLIDTNDIIKQNRIAKEDDIKMVDDMIDNEEVEEEGEEEVDNENDNDYVVETAERATKGKPRIYQNNTVNTDSLSHSKDNVMEDIPEDTRENIIDNSPNNTRDGTREGTREDSVPSFTGFSDNSQSNKKDSLFREIF